jgi:hypothetical protein
MENKTNCEICLSEVNRQNLRRHQNTSVKCKSIQDFLNNDNNTSNVQRNKVLEDLVEKLKAENQELKYKIVQLERDFNNEKVQIFKSYSDTYLLLLQQQCNNTKCSSTSISTTATTVKEANNDNRINFTDIKIKDYTLAQIGSFLDDSTDGEMNIFKDTYFSEYTPDTISIQCTDENRGNYKYFNDNKWVNDNGSFIAMVFYDQLIPIFKDAYEELRKVVESCEKTPRKMDIESLYNWGERINKLKNPNERLRLLKRNEIKKLFKNNV